MKRRVRPKPEFAIASRVDELLREFQFPDTSVRPKAKQPPVGGGGGGEMSVTVAASDASEFEIARADFVCDGVDDEEEILAAIDTLSAWGGRVKLSSGNFWASPNALTIDVGDLWIQGTGPLSTIIRPDSAVNNSHLIRFSVTSGDNKLSDMTIFGVNPGGGTATGQRGLRISGSGDFWLEDVWFQANVYSIYSEMNQVRIRGMRSFITTYDFYCPDDGYRDIQISDSYLAGYLHFENAVNVSVQNNTLGASIVGTDARGWNISNNSWLGTATFDNALIDLSMDLSGDSAYEGCVINGNTAGEMSFNFLDANGVERLTVSNNRCTYGAFWIVNCPGVIVVGNGIKWAFGSDGAADVAAFHFDGCAGGVVGKNHAEDFYLGGFYFDACTDMIVVGNRASNADDLTDNTYDGYQIFGASGRVSLISNESYPTPGGTSMRYGINIAAGNDDVVYANMLGDSSEYGTADSVDAGTNTQLAPAAGAIGGQFAY